MGPGAVFVPLRHPVITRVPFLDLAAPHRELRDELRRVFETALDTSQFVGGRMVEAFEEEFAALCQTRFCIGVNSGTDGLRFALMAAGVRPGDTVVTVPMTFIATTEAISQAGAHFDLVDIDARTYTLDPERLRAYLETQCARDEKTGRLISKRTQSPVTAIVPVHLYGQVADMDPIIELANRYGLVVVEDACQAHGAGYFSRRDNTRFTAGSIGRAAAFSFYPGKNLGACGEAGAITTNDPEVARICRLLRDHGQSAKYMHDIEGYNGRLDAMQAGILSAKLRRLPKWNEQRREHAGRYGELLGGMGDALTLPYEPEWSRSVYHIYAVRLPARERLREHLTAEGIGTGIHYPVPLHRLAAYAHLGYREGDFPVTEQTAAQVLSLPMFPELLPEQQQIVAKAVQALIG
jgi:dTDP-4-amino-4,6-dideoxygalactose transaminase